MRYSLLLAIAILLFTACKKDKYTTAPQIEYKSLNPNTAFSNIPCLALNGPNLTIHVTDAEGDLGYNDRSDTAYVFVKNLKTSRLDSIKFPTLTSIASKNFSANIEINLACYLTSSGPGPRTDTLYYEVYVRDFAKNISNKITNTDPIYYITP